MSKSWQLSITFKFLLNYILNLLVYDKDLYCFASDVDR